MVAQGCATPVDQPPGGDSNQNSEVYTPQEGLSAQQRLQAVLDLLEGGEPVAARSELVLYLEEQASSKVGADLLSQIDLPSSEYFPEDYREVQLRPGQTLSNLSEHYLGSLYRFHALAKYNDIEQPRSLKVGQTVRIPLTRRAHEVFAAADTADRTEALPAIVPEPEPVPPAAEPPPPEPTPVDIDQLHSDALKAYRAQDLDTAISLWDQILVENPSHENARLYRSQALELKKTLGSANLEPGQR
jgi:LysM domain